ncbi:hypothetical protein D3878_03775 [Noviherbaspirillum sedimenti]|uniref:Uncharacterized protein n=1 Tax=Noviherbaspirillum sedimenti TaxID=2320865 RepID=A0A3A3FYV2_9BURK|nr:hypothetical protein D3878_03775 [Noviherbaspirillum sedimenti]
MREDITAVAEAKNCKTTATLRAFQSIQQGESIDIRIGSCLNMTIRNLASVPVNPTRRVN